VSPTDPPPPGQAPPAEGEPIPAGSAQLSVILALADVNRAVLRLNDVAMACARALDASTTGGRP
jgi:hypothetical protein